MEDRSRRPLDPCRYRREKSYAARYCRDLHRCVGLHRRPQAPAENVTPYFTGDAKTTESVLNRIAPQLLDPDRRTTVTHRHTLDGRGRFATVSPVSNVGRFASRSSFGNITQRDKREICVSVDPAQAYATVVFYSVADFIDKLPARLRLWRAIAKSHFVAIVIGQDFGDVT